MSAEEWRVVDVAPDYEVSNLGRVRSNRGHHVAEIRRPSVTRSGHLRIQLAGPNGLIQIFVHRLVATAFIGPQPADKPVMRHLDGDPTNNVPANLAWGTFQENERDKVRHGANPNASKTHCPANHPYTQENIYFTREGWRMCRECSRERSRQWRAARAGKREAA
jgi:hypothetical protein